MRHVTMGAGLLCLAGCVDGGRASMEAPVVVVPAAFEGGGAYTLSEAWILISDLRMEEPGIAARPAHPGHDSAGATTGELLGRWQVDLLGQEQPLGVATLLEGEFATAKLSLVADDEGVVALFRGSAARAEGGEMPFELVVVEEELLSGLPFEQTLTAANPPGQLELGVEAAVMLSWVDWQSPDTDADGVLTVADGSLLNAVHFGVTSLTAWSLRAAP